MYGTHPYGHLALGDERSLREMDVQEVARFHAATVTPPGVTVVAAGALREDELLSVVGDALSRTRVRPGSPWSLATAPRSPSCGWGISPRGGIHPTTRPCS
jgi:predicted Zn-dependent peptidase